MSKLLIGIGYKRKRGKDTVANRLVDRHGFIRISWADSLKEACRHIFGFSDVQLYGDLKEVVDPYWGKSPRQILQEVGTDALRNHFDDQIWIKSAWLKIEKALQADVGGVVVPDVRFPNEAEFIKSKGGVLWRIDRDIEEDVNSLHSSETSMDDYQGWDRVINNNGSIRDLYDRVDYTLSSLNTQKSTRRLHVLNRR